jgi:hypothetical protein
MIRQKLLSIHKNACHLRLDQIILLMISNGTFHRIQHYPYLTTNINFSPHLLGQYLISIQSRNSYS